MVEGQRTEASVAASSVSKLAYLVFLCAPNMHRHRVGAPPGAALCFVIVLKGDSDRVRVSGIGTGTVGGKS